jgi:hypothetical protein
MAKHLESVCVCKHGHGPAYKRTRPSLKNVLSAFLNKPDDPTSCQKNSKKKNPTLAEV